MTVQQRIWSEYDYQTIDQALARLSGGLPKPQPIKPTNNVQEIDGRISFLHVELLGQLHNMREVMDLLRAERDDLTQTTERQAERIKGLLDVRERMEREGTEAVAALTVLQEAADALTTHNRELQARINTLEEAQQIADVLDLAAEPQE